jgi:hypothetical protein
LSDETYVCTCKPLHRLVGMPGSPSVNSRRAILQLIILIAHAGEGYPALQNLQRSAAGHWPKLSRRTDLVGSASDSRPTIASARKFALGQCTMSLRSSPLRGAVENSDGAMQSSALRIER